MPDQSDGDNRPEDTLANDSVRYLLLRMQLPTMQEVKTLDRRRRQTGRILSTSRNVGQCRRALSEATNLMRTYGAMTAAAVAVWTGTVALSERSAGFAPLLFLMIIVGLGAAILGGAYFTYRAFVARRRSAQRLEHLEDALWKMTTALAPRLSVERVIAEAKLSYPKFNAERRRIDGVKDTVRLLRGNVAAFWWDVIVTMQEADRRQVDANLDEFIRREAEQYLCAWGQPPMLVDSKAEPRFGWSGYTEGQVREWEHWSHLIAAASGSRRAMAAMGVPMPSSGPVQLPPEILPHSNRWQESHGIAVGQGVIDLQEQPVADFEAALHLGEGPGQKRFLSLVAPSERSHVEELLHTAEGPQS